MPGTGADYFVTALCDYTLAEWMIKLKNVARHDMVEGLLQGLKYIHESQEILHCDISVSCMFFNIIILAKTNGESSKRHVRTS